MGIYSTIISYDDAKVQLHKVFISGRHFEVSFEVHLLLLISQALFLLLAFVIICSSISSSMTASRQFI